MMTRCKPLLGTFVEISIDEDVPMEVINSAFASIEMIQSLMGFHHPQSKLSQINRLAHQKAVNIHPWTSQVLTTAKKIHRHSHGLFNCGIGHRLVTAGLLPQHINLANLDLGGIEDIHFLAPDLIQSNRPVCLDLGGIAKGFAVDMAVKILISEGCHSGIVNAGGDLRLFGDTPKRIHIRSPDQLNQLLDIGEFQNCAIATSSLHFSKRDCQQSHIINPLAIEENGIHINFEGSYSILAKECIYADALTKVLAISGQERHPCFDRFNAQAIRITA